MTRKNTILAIILVAILTIITGLSLGIVKAEVLGTHLTDLDRVATTSATLPDRLVGLNYPEAKAVVLDRVDLTVSERALDLDTLQTQASASLLEL